MWGLWGRLVLCVALVLLPQAFSLLPGRRKRQYISKKRPSCFVIPSLRSRASSERELWISRRTEILRCAQDDTPSSASFDSQNVFFEMYWTQASLRVRSRLRGDVTQWL